MNQINRVTVADQKNLANLYVGNTASNLRIGIDKDEKRILDLNILLLNLRANESIIKARIYNNMANVNDFKAGSNTQVDPVQSFSKSNTDPNPNRAIPISEYNILNKTYGMQELYTVLNAIDHDIQATMAQIKLLELERDSFKVQLLDAETKFKNPLTSVARKIGIIPPTSSDLEKDKIQKARLANIQLLFEISQSYSNLSVDDKGQRRFTDDPVMPNNLRIIGQTFSAHAQQFPEYINGQRRLNFDDPGADWNKTVLQSDLNDLREVGVNNKTNATVGDFVKTIASVTNDTNTSKNLSTVPTPALPQSNSMNYRTRAFSASATRMGVSYPGSFEIIKFTDSIQKWWKNKNNNLMPGLPQCKNVVKPTPTSTDTSPERALAAQEDDAAKERGQSEFEIAIKNGTEAKNKINVLSQIPADAPSWVLSYAANYESATYGDIVFLGKEYYVTLITSDTVESAQAQSAKVLDSDFDLLISEIATNVASYAYDPNPTSGAGLADSIVVKQVILYTLWKPNEESAGAVSAPTPEEAAKETAAQAKIALDARHALRVKQQLDEVDAQIAIVNKTIADLLLPTVVNVSPAGAKAREDAEKKLSELVNKKRLIVENERSYEKGDFLAIGRRG